MTELRPRSIAELLRLALAVFGRCWLGLLAALAIAVIPATLLFVLIVHVVDELARSRSGRPAALDASLAGWVVVLGPIVFALAALALGAAFVVVAATLDGQPADPRTAVRRAARRWWTLLAVDVTALILGSAAMFVLLVSMALFAVLDVRSAGGLPASAFPADELPLFVAANVLFTIAGSLGTMTWFAAKLSAAVETNSPVTAVTSALTRIFNRKLFWRTLGFVVALAAAEFLVEMVAVGVLSLSGAARPVPVAAGIPPPPAWFVPLGIVLTLTFVTERVVLTTVYVRDVEVRLEGFDLARAAETVRELPADADGLNEDDRALIAAFLTRRAVLSAAATRALAAKIAARTRPKLQASFAHLGDEELLEHLGRPQN